MAILPHAQPLTEQQKALAGKWLPLAKREANRRATTQREREDLIEANTIALMRCARTYDPDKGFTFQAQLMRAFSNAAIDVHRKRARSRECAMPEWALDRAVEHDPAPPRPQRPEEPEPPPDPPNLRKLARDAAMAALRDGRGYRAAALAAEGHLGRAVHRRQLNRWAGRAGLLQKRGRPKKVDPRTILRMLSDPRFLPGAWVGVRVSRRAVAGAAGICLRTMYYAAKNETPARRLPRASRVDSHMTPDKSQPIAPSRARLTALLKVRGMTVGKFANRLEISTSYLYESIVQRYWPEARLAKMRQILGAEGFDFVTGKTDVMPKQARPRT